MSIEEHEHEKRCLCGHFESEHPKYKVEDDIMTWFCNGSYHTLAPSWDEECQLPVVDKNVPLMNNGREKIPDGQLHIT